MTGMAPRAPKGMCGLPLFAGFPFTAGAAPFPCGAFPARGGRQIALPSVSLPLFAGEDPPAGVLMPRPSPPLMEFFHRKWLMFYFLKAFPPLAGGLLLEQASCCRLSSFTSLARVLLLNAILKDKDLWPSPCSRDSPMPAIFHVQQAAGPERLARFRHDGSVPPERAVL